MNSLTRTMQPPAFAGNPAPAFVFFHLEVAPGSELWEPTNDFARFLTHDGRRMLLGQLVTRPARALEVSR